LNELQQNGVQAKASQTALDYLYFAVQSISGSAVRGMPSWFRVDSTTAATYNLTDLLE
ncbi:MAG: hypothetical protein HY519_02150, partial [Candidatus Aenigmarchaeota archaeon]|nr:hypothetical protein [Candidatus Aenigmarchaeota archaeon]